jgi:hypothetical protein
MQIQDLPQSKQVSDDNSKAKQQKQPDEEDINITLPNADEKNKNLEKPSKENDGKLAV